MLSRNYNTMAAIGHFSLKEILHDVPEYEKYLLRHIFQYKYSYKDYIWKVMKKIEPLKDLTIEMFHNILYAIKRKVFADQEMLLKEFDDVRHIFIVESGCVEIFTYFEGNEFVIDQLSKGSIINPRVAFTEDKMEYNMRCSGQTTLVSLSMRAIVSLFDEHPDFRKKIQLYTNTLLKKGKKFPLDYSIP